MKVGGRYKDINIPYFGGFAAGSCMHLQQQFKALYVDKSFIFLKYKTVYSYLLWFFENYCSSTKKFKEQTQIYNATYFLDYRAHFTKLETYIYKLLTSTELSKNA